MPRPPSTVTKSAPWWDPDESATFRSTITLLAQQEVRMRLAWREHLNPLDTPEKVRQNVESLAQDVLTYVTSWTLRDRTLSYEDAQARGITRPSLEVSIASIVEYLDEDDVVYLLLRGAWPQDEAAQTAGDRATGDPFSDESAEPPQPHGAGAPPLPESANGRSSGTKAKAAATAG